MSNIKHWVRLLSNKFEPSISKIRLRMTLLCYCDHDWWKTKSTTSFTLTRTHEWEFDKEHP